MNFRFWILDFGFWNHGRSEAEMAEYTEKAWALF